MNKIPMVCIQSAAIRVMLALMLGLLVVSGYVVAPILFAKAGSAAEAGRLAGAIFHVVNDGVVFLSIAVAAFWLRMKFTSKMSWGLLLILGSLAAINEFGVAPVIADLKLAAGPIDQLADDDPFKTKFGLWHGLSAVIHLLATLASLALLLTGAHRRPACTAQDADAQHADQGESED